jgi:N-glycosylase/DNA lyase
MHGLEYDELKKRLMGIGGVGDKVADCILLFGYGKHEAFPVDVWIKRVVEEVYFNGKGQKAASIHDFANERWGKHAGYAQQYIFEFGRRNKIGVRK